MSGIVCVLRISSARSEVSVRHMREESVLRSGAGCVCPREYRYRYVLSAGLAGVGCVM